MQATELPQIASTRPSAGIDEQNKPFRGQQRTLGMPVSVVYKVLLRNIFSPARIANVLSNRQSSHYCCSRLYVGACLSISDAADRHNVLSKSGDKT